MAGLLKYFGPKPEYENPGITWRKEINAKYRTTDIYKLEQYAAQHLFIHDRLLPSHADHKLLTSHPESKYRATAFSVDHYSLWKRDQGIDSFPIPLTASFTGVPLARIKGQIWRINPSLFIELDKTKENQLLSERVVDKDKANIVKFRRIRTKFVIPYRPLNGGAPGDVRVYIIRAWMYVGNHLYWDDCLDAGMDFRPVQLFDELYAGDVGELYIGAYYYFSRMEY